MTHKSALRNPHPRMVQYGLESMAGDPVEILHRHLTNNHAATLGAKDMVISRLRELLREAKPHLYAVERRSWCWCADGRPDRGPGDHDTDCKWVADVERVGALRMEIERITSDT